MAYRSKALATWLACLTGAFGAHRFYLHGLRDVWAWLHPWPTLAGLYGIHRVQTLGQDDQWSWLLLPLLGLMVAQACLFAIIYGLTSDAVWDSQRNPSHLPRNTRWLPVLGVIAALMIGATALMATIAFGGQRFFEWQVEESKKISGLNHSRRSALSVHLLLHESSRLCRGALCRRPVHRSTHR